MTGKELLVLLQNTPQEDLEKDVCFEDVSDYGVCSFGTCPIESVAIISGEIALITSDSWIRDITCDNPQTKVLYRKG